MLMKWKTADYCDACEDAQVCELNFIGFGRRRAFSGRIRTVRCDDGLSAVRDLVRQPGVGQVLVIDGIALPWRALFGDVMGGIAVESGWEGIVVNGYVRDCDELDAMDLGVKALGASPRRANPRGLGAPDVEDRFGRVLFAVGSILLADDDGVIVLPPGVTELDLNVGGNQAPQPSA